MSEWQPIETAPKGGTRVLVYIPKRLGFHVTTAQNPTGNQWWSLGYGSAKPTHWMPLPEPPK